MSTYWSSRKNLIYYRYVELIVKGVAANAESAIDIGSGNTSCMEWFDWIQRRYALDRGGAYSSNSVKGIKSDFLQYEVEEKFDLALCLQVLEHIPDASTFARKLFEVARAVLISVPYKWNEDDCEYHVHDPVNLEKLVSWVGRKPDYYVIVTEPLLPLPLAQRLIAYYHPADKPFSLTEARKTLLTSLKKPS